MREYKYMSLSEIAQYEPEMKMLGVSEVARSPRGFLTAYKRVGGNPNNLSEAWRVKRHGFIRRFLPTWGKYRTDKVKLALIAWAYMPN